jgi:hypothetical protein
MTYLTKGESGAQADITVTIGPSVPSVLHPNPVANPCWSLSKKEQSQLPEFHFHTSFASFITTLKQQEDRPVWKERKETSKLLIEKSWWAVLWYYLSFF